MYLARTTLNHPTHFYIRHTFRDGDVLKSRNVFSLGTDPSRYIVYPGGKGYYFDEEIEDTLQGQGLNPTQDELDHIFWEFLDPEIKRVINGFQRVRGKEDTAPGKTIAPVHLFDQRRVHYLRFAQVDQCNPSKMPPELCKHLQGKSRDEIEQYFLSEERILRRHELKKYVSTIFDLNTLLSRAYRRHGYETMDQSSMDDCFTAAVCELNDDMSFWSGMPATSRLQEYMVRYVVMYFDYAFPTRPPSRDYLNDFMNRHRQYVPPEKVRRSKDEAGRLFETDWQKLKQMDRRNFTRLYRRLALKHHPDQGGSKKKFIRLTKFYRYIVKNKH